MAVPKVKLSLQPIPKSIVRVSVAGEFLKNMGLTNEADIRNIQQAVAEGLVSELVVVGVSAANIGKERFILRFDPLGRDDIIHLELADGKSTTEALDTGFAGALAYSVHLLKRRALSPRFYIIWSPQALSNRVELGNACQRLNLTTDAGPLPSFQPDAYPSLPMQPPSSSPPVTWNAEAPPPPPNHVYKPVLTIRPGKEPGISYAIETATRIR